MKPKDPIKIVYLSCPLHIVDYFEDQAKQELEEEGTEVNHHTLSRMRNNMMISALEGAITVYEEIGT